MRMRIAVIAGCFLLLNYIYLKEAIMNPTIIPHLATGAAMALAFILIGLVIGILIGIKLEDHYDLDSGGRNYRRKGK